MSMDIDGWMDGRIVDGIYVWWDRKTIHKGDDRRVMSVSYGFREEMQKVGDVWRCEPMTEIGLKRIYSLE